MAIAVVTAGGDCPGLNAVIRAVVTRCSASGVAVVGSRNGWQGLMEGSVVSLDRDSVRGVLARGGTILGTSRLDPYVHGDGLASIAPALERWEIDSVIVIGGDGTLRSASKLIEEGLAVIGVPKTIDNDIAGTDLTFGFDTACQIATDAIDRLTTTAESHNRVMVVEVMGRTAGWIATSAGMAGGAEIILVPEEPYEIETVATRIRNRHTRGHTYSMVVVAEGTPAPAGEFISQGPDGFGFPRLGGIGHVIGAALEHITGFETRVTVLGHVQRGGTPTAFDRVLATRLGLHAAELAMSGATGVMAALSGTEIVTVSLEQACATPRTVPQSRLQEASWFYP